MNKIYALLSLILSLQSFAAAQEATTIWLDENKDTCTKNEASFVRKVWPDLEGKDQVRDYYLNGQLALVGTFKSGTEVEEGPFILYHENGNEKAKGKFQNGLHVGVWERWFANGHPDNVTNHQDSFYNGLCTWYYEEGGKCAEVIYQSGIVLQKKYFDKAGQIETDKDHEPVFKKGDPQALPKWVAKHLHYPKKARKKRQEGRVVLSFIVDKTGAIQNVRIRKSAFPALDKEALRLMKLMPEWTPGVKHNRPEDIETYLPITFKLK